MGNDQQTAIVVEDLEKRYGRTVAVTGLTFDLRQGEILGLIGPNGAGKTTTLRMLTGFLAPTRGRIEVLGVDRARNALAASSSIGYLPENVPVYPELTVWEYLFFRARLKGLSGKRRRTRVEAVLEALDLAPMARRQLGDLSKGYRQRVGVAAALLNEPPVLILDEPTIGLDPAQMRQFRALLVGLKAQHALLVSSHILSELERVCDRVLMLHQGRRMALDEPARLLERVHEARVLVLEARADPDGLEAALRQVPGVAGLDREPTGEAGWTRFRVHAHLEAGSSVDAAVGQTVQRVGGVVRRLQPEPVADLETVFHRLLAEGGGPS
jgi:gliding motility-associated transport system ATP-binding protein